MKLVSTSNKNNLARINVNKIIPDPEQPRKKISRDSLGDLSRSVQSTSQINPITVRPTTEGRYMIVVGERRYKAALAADRKYIECIVRDDIDDQKAKDMQLAENYQREDIDPLDQAKFISNYLSKYNLSQNALSKRTGIPQRTISDRLALLNLPISVHAKLQNGSIGPSEAVKIAALPEEKRDAVIKAVSAGKIGGRKLEKLIKLTKTEPQAPIDEIIEQQQMKPDQLDRIVMTTLTNLLEPVMQRTISRKRAECTFFENDACSVWHLANGESLPPAIGYPVEADGKWLVKPSMLLCSFCSEDSNWRLESLEKSCKANSLSSLAGRFKCSCGSQGKVAVPLACTKCNSQACYTTGPSQDEVEDEKPVDQAGSHKNM